MLSAHAKVRRGNAALRRALTSPMKRCLCILGALLLMAACHAQPANQAQSAACIQALDALQTREATMRAEVIKPDAAWQTLRRRAAQACLGGTGDAPPPTRTLQAPIAIAPIGSPAPYPPYPQSTPRSGATGSPSPTPKPPSVVTSCDALGCWANDGTRLNRVGPAQLQGPRGLCTLQGTALQCP